MTALVGEFSLQQASFERLLDSIQAVEQENTKKSNMETICSDHFSLMAKDVKYAYPNQPVDKLIINGFNMRIGRGETVVLTGERGKGKSTLLKLLCGLYKPLEGEVYIQFNKNCVFLEDILPYVGFVPQEPLLFSASIFENIAWGKAGASKQEVEDAARIAGAHKFICTLAEGYKTRLNEKNMRLSGGEAQRIAIARAIIKNPLIIFMDEPTSAQDSATQAQIIESLISKNYTMVLSSHKADTRKILRNVRTIEL